ncbi:MAG: hypothetical protein ACKO6E_10560 [Planctomycetota bacterium]
MDIILTGIARSGTTLTCALLNKLPQAVALHEPMNPGDLVGLGYPDEYLARIADFFSAQRTSLMEAGRAVSKARDGRVPENPFAQTADQGGLRHSTVDNQDVQFGKQLAEGFRLAVKHPNFFTATLETLRTRYPCFAVVRMPLAVLLSWHSIKAPVNEGRLPFGEAFDPVLRRTLDAEPDRVRRQFAILRWYFSRYRELLPPEHVIRYEDLVASGGRALAVIDPDAAFLAESLESRNTSRLYDASLVRDLAGRLLAESTIYEGFYTADDIAALRDAWVTGGRA